MMYPTRVINRRLKHRIIPALVISQGVFDSLDKKAKVMHRQRFPIYIFMLMIIVNFIVVYILIISPLLNIMDRESSVISSIQQMSEMQQPLLLSELLEQHSINIIHQTSFGDNQVVITLNPNVPIDVVIDLLSQVVGVFSFQYSQDGFQIFLARGSL